VPATSPALILSNTRKEIIQYNTGQYFLLETIS
jgi:hypothetical protein